MSFNSVNFLIFFPIVVLIYYLIPQKWRYIWILIASYYFYLNWNVSYGLILFGITLITYLSGRILENRKSKAALSATILSCLLVLGIFKYLDFFFANLQRVFSLMKIGLEVPGFSIVLPIGISFYIFQSMGYVIDVYRGETKAEKNFLMYAAFISFFPQLVAGPIERAGNLLHQFYEEHTWDWNRVRRNLLLMLWGFYMKVVIADRAAIFVDRVFRDYEQYSGWVILTAAVLFAFQIYCDFAGYSLIAIGAAGVMGFKLMENFKAPYCATGIRDFWARWHISLTGWFRDYVYIPLGGNRKGKVRKALNTIIVFFLSGLWHGASWSYVIWGVINGFFIIVEDFLDNLLKPVLNKASGLKKVLGPIITFIVVDFAWIFFRARSTKTALEIVRRIFPLNNFSVFYDNTIHFYIMEKHTFWGLLIFILILMIVDFIRSRYGNLAEVIERKNTAIRWIIYDALILAILVFGVWGPTFDETSFIYFQF